MRRLAVPTSSVAMPALPPASARGSRRREWLGNALLGAAIAALVGSATYVLVHERMTEHPTAPALRSR